MGAMQAVLLMLAVLLIWHLRSVVMLLFAAVVGAVAMDMPVTVLERRCPCMPRPCAVLVVVVGMLLTVWLLTIFLLPEVFFQCRELAALGPHVFEVVRKQSLVQLEALEAVLEQRFEVERFTFFRTSIQERLEDPTLYSSLLRHLRPAGVWILQGIGAHIAIFGRCLMVLILATQLCLRPEEHRAILVNALPAFYRRRASEILDRCHEALGALLVALAISAFGVGFLTWLGLTVLGCPLALFSGALSGTLQFIPTVGPPLGILIPSCVALVVSGWLSWRVLLLGIVVQYVVKPILRPQVMRWYVTILPTTAILAQAGFGLLLGFPGALLALPFLAVWQVVLREAFQRDIMDRWVIWEWPNSFRGRHRRHWAKRHADGRVRVRLAASRSK
uniref:AI-2E family transporter n=1 Tax=Alexandrium monilatum TaxID=311494 RepID=A0A7S4PS53_9DINO